MARTLPEIIGAITDTQAAYFNNGYCTIVVYRAGKDFVQTSGEGDAHPDIQEDQQELYSGIGEYAEVPLWHLQRLAEEDRVVEVAR